MVYENSRFFCFSSFCYSNQVGTSHGKLRQARTKGSVQGLGRQSGDGWKVHSRAWRFFNRRHWSGWDHLKRKPRHFMGKTMGQAMGKLRDVFNPVKIWRFFMRIFQLEGWWDSVGIGDCHEMKMIWCWDIRGFNLGCSWDAMIPWWFSSPPCCLGTGAEIYGEIVFDLHATVSKYFQVVRNSENGSW